MALLGTALVFSISLSLLVHSTVSAQEPRKDMSSLHAVIFGILVDIDGKFNKVRVAEVRNRQNEKVDLNIDQEYLRQAFELIKNHGYKPQIENGVAKEFFTYFYYDTKRPGYVIDDLSKFSSVPANGGTCRDPGSDGIQQDHHVSPWRQG